MDYKALVLDDPRMVEREIAGKTWKFWLCRRGFRIAKDNYGYDPAELTDGDDDLDRVVRLLWLAHLPFAPSLPYDDFEIQFLSGDYAALVSAAQEINAKQTSAAKEEAPPKKQQGKR